MRVEPGITGLEWAFAAKTPHSRGGNTGEVIVIGCDPGPVSSAVVSVTVPLKGKCTIRGAWYLTNKEWADPHNVNLVLDESCGLWRFFAYERIKASYGTKVGFSVTDTAAMSGDLRCSFREHVDGIYALGSSDWRHAITGRGNANDKMTKEFLVQFFDPYGGSSNPYKGTAKQPGPWWPLVVAGAGGNMGHLVDAVGTAIGLTQVRFMSGKDPEEFRTF